MLRGEGASPTGKEGVADGGNYFAAAFFALRSADMRLSSSKIMAAARTGMHHRMIVPVISTISFFLVSFRF